MGLRGPIVGPFWKWQLSQRRITLTEKLQVLKSKAVLQAIFLEDLAGLADDEYSVSATEKGNNCDLKDILLPLENAQERI